MRDENLYILNLKSSSQNVNRYYFMKRTMSLMEVLGGYAKLMTYSKITFKTVQSMRRSLEGQNKALNLLCNKTGIERCRLYQL